jgi:starch phosphorylase
MTAVIKQAAGDWEPIRTGSSTEALKLAVLDNLTYIQARLPQFAPKHDYYMALAYAVRDRLLHRWVNTVQTFLRQDVKVACYLSAEFLIGPQLQQFSI